MYGALLGVAGGAAGAVGGDMTRRAMENASNWYNRELQAYYAREQSTAKDFRRQYQGVGDARLNQIGSTLSEYMAPSYERTAGDTSTIDAALAQFRPGNPGAGGSGAAAGWGATVDANTRAATGRQRGVAGDASMLRRIGDSQSGALNEMGIADQRFGRQVSDIQDLQQLRSADFAHELQALNMRGQRRFDRASQAGSDWTSVGSYLGAGGQLASGWEASRAPATTQQRQFDTGSDADYFRRS